MSKIVRKSEQNKKKMETKMQEVKISVEKKIENVQVDRYLMLKKQKL